ncbi:MAG: hypothetical protein N3A57_03500 [Negativicutes bacterium]|nr:hypothetical protein [Negativicutes bacterium]
MLAVVLGCLAVGGAAAAGIKPAPEPKNDAALQAAELPAFSADYQGTLLLSNSPESVPRSGVLYRDTVGGFVRIFIHHLNDTPFEQRLAVVLENGAKDNRIEVLRRAAAGPDPNPLVTGKQAQGMYFSYNQPPAVVELGTGQSAELDCQLSDKIMATGDVVTAVVDFYAASPVTVRVMMLRPHVSADKFAVVADELSGDGRHPRGTFPGTERIMNLKQVFVASKVMLGGITLGDGMLDSFQRGYDAVSGQPAVNHGNYGLNYNIFIPTADNGERFTVYANARGSHFAGYCVWRYGDERQIVPLPREQLSFGDSPWSGYFALAGAETSGRPLWLTMSPPGGSNMPVRLILVYNGRFG